ncbi:hypothetical protein ACFQ60_46965 [Streptomyces zhihengii]
MMKPRPPTLEVHQRAEGDHLIVLDDVAIIVEDKAVALSALSRGARRHGSVPT